MAPEERLLSEFPIPTLAEWNARAARELRGKTPDDFRWEPDEGIRAPALFTKADIETLPHLATRGLLVPAQPFRIRQRIDAATPESAARHCRQAIAGGANELLIRFDRLARRGVDPGTPAGTDLEQDRLEAQAGEDGCAIYHADALDQVLAAVDLAATHVAFDAGVSGLAVLDMLRESPHDPRPFELGLDPIGDIASGPVRGEGPDLDMRWRAVEVDVPYAVHSAPYHNAGATAAQELGCVIATAIDYLRALIPDRDPDAAMQSICLRIATNTDIYAEIAKLRAARLLWAKIGHGFEATALQARIHAESSNRPMSGDDVHTNLLRTNVQAFIAALSGCDSITIAPFDRTHDERDDHAQTIARNQMILLRDEALLQRVADPCGGSFTIEWLTDAIARGAWSFVQEIEAQGGMIAALRAGFVQERIATAAANRRGRVDRVERTLVGVNRYVDARFRKGATATPDIDAVDATDAIEAAHFDYLEARGDIELEPVDGASARGATVGEMVQALHGAGWTGFPELLDQTPESASFEQLSHMVQREKLAVQPIVVGKTKLARARAEFARDLFAAGGFEVRDPRTPDDPVPPDVAIVVLCGEDPLVDEFTAELTPKMTGRRVCIAAPPRELDATFVYRGCNAYALLRAIYLDLTGGPESDDTEEDA